MRKTKRGTMMYGKACAIDDASGGRSGISDSASSMAWMMRDDFVRRASSDATAAIKARIAARTIG